jgi:hypothetical protein
MQAAASLSAVVSIVSHAFSTALFPAAVEDATFASAVEMAERTTHAAHSSDVQPDADAEVRPSSLPLQLGAMPLSYVTAAVAEDVLISAVEKEATTPASACETTDRAICAGPGAESAGASGAARFDGVRPAPEGAAPPPKAVALAASAAMQADVAVRVEPEKSTLRVLKIVGLD